MPDSDHLSIIRRLTSLPHRGTGTSQEKEAANIIENILISAKANVERQIFKTSKTYIWEIIVLTVLIAAGLILGHWFPASSIGIITFCIISSFLYFDWRSSPLTLLSPSVESENIIGRNKRLKKQKINEFVSQDKKHLILMAHYDSAPVSLLYLPSMVKNFRFSLLINLFLICFALIISTLGFFAIGQPVITWLRFILAAYFLIQGVITSFDYFRYGYTNGAGDNATGVAAAIITAKRLWENPVAGLDVRVVLTGAEETGMTGSKAYLKKYRKFMSPDNTFVLNFDSIGDGELKIITETGSLSRIRYNNKLVDAAIKTAQTEARFSSVKQAKWSTGDFDTLWFARAGIPSLTLSAQTKTGSIPNLHRPEDVCENIDKSLPAFSSDFAESLIRQLNRNNDL